MKIAFLGIGLMGLPMARNLLNAGHEVIAWNRSAAKAAPLADHGAVVADSVAQAVAPAELVISILSDGAAVSAVIHDALPAITRGATWVDMSSTKPDEARAAADQLAKAQVFFLDAPVSGGTKGAEAGTLAIMAGGQVDHFNTAKPALSAMGRPVLVGPVGSGQLAKLANQMIVANTIAAVAEAMLLLEKGGANAAAVRDALKGGFADSTILQQHGERMTTGNFTPGGLSRLQLKDIDNALAEAAKSDLILPVSEQTRARFARYVHELGGAEKDHSGLYQELLDLNAGHG